MATVICPGENWKYQLGTNPPTSEDTVVGEDTVASLANDNGFVRLFVKDFSPQQTVKMYAEFDEGVSIIDDNMVIIDTKATSPPTFFQKFSVYMEDCNGISATYSLDNNMVGKEEIILNSAFVPETEDFNKSFITKIGFIFSNTDAVRDFTFILSEMYTVYRIQPTYAEPQEVIEFLGMVDNKGNPFRLTDYSNPSYNAVAKRIVEAEYFVENTCRDAWAEKRVVKEIRNSDSAVWASSFGYLGIISPDGSGAGVQAFFVGIPVKLVHDKIHTIDYEKGDCVEVRRYGSTWVKINPSAVWCDEAKGIIYIKDPFFQKNASVRVTYRYGSGPCPPDIKQAVILKSALIIIGTDWYRQRFPQSPMFDPMKQETASSWVWQIKDLLRPYTSVISCGNM